MVGVTLCTILLPFSPWESRLDTTALLYLLVVVGAAFMGGLGPGVVTATAAFLLMNHNFIPPTGGLTVTHPGDVMAALTFLVVAGVIGHLIIRTRREAVVRARLQREATEAEILRRSDEMKSVLLATGLARAGHAAGGDQGGGHQSRTG